MVVQIWRIEQCAQASEEEPLYNHRHLNSIYTQLPDKLRTTSWQETKLSLK
jgi:hypothetical protein